MAPKVFISYRRQDSGANAIGISQYLENEFGRRNVYIDVGMQAGIKYPAVIEKRLAECKVLLVLMGPDWLTSKDERDQLRLQKPDDWVRLEIARALKRGITVIPVLINGAQIPEREALPDDIRGLLDHQTASVSIASFRNDMAGLTRDIRALRKPTQWRFLATAAAIIIALALCSLVYRTASFYGFSLRELNVQTGGTTTLANGLWKSGPGEWVMYAYDNFPVAYFINPNSIKMSGDRVLFTDRYPLHGPKGSPTVQSRGQGAFEDETTVIDCKKSIFAQAERIVYDSSGETIFNFKTGDLESVDISNGQPIPAGSILLMAQKIVCNGELRALLSKKSPDLSHFSYLANSPNGDGSILYGPISSTSNSTYPFQALFVTKLNREHSFKEVMPNPNVLGVPAGYRIAAQLDQINCSQRTILAPALEYYDQNKSLVYLSIDMQDHPLNVVPNSIFDLLLNVACNGGANVAGDYEGRNNAQYEKKGVADQKIFLTIKQSGNDLAVSFQTPLGGEGSGTGKLVGNRVDALALHSTAPECPGSYDGSLSFSGNAVSWLYKGQDCGGAMEGHGTATKVVH